MKFDWDAAKAAANLRKHGVSFEEATTVFSDPKLIHGFDAAHSIDEDRWQLIGMSQRSRVLVVVMTERWNDVIWIINARKATRQEIRLYEEAIKKPFRD